MVSGTGNRRLLPLVLVTGLTLLALDAIGFGPIDGLRRGVLTASPPIRSIVVTVASPLTSTWNGAVHYDDVVEENRRLRLRLAEADGLVAAQPDVLAELVALTEAVDIPYALDVERVTARVVADRRTGLERIVELDRGSDHGVVRGMPVVTGSGLVGVIAAAVEGRSVVRLLSDPETAVGVRTDHGLGLIVGRSGADLEFRPGPELARAIERGQVGRGDRLTTSGLEGSQFPAGIPVATVIERDGPTVAAEADLDVLGYVTVLLADRPA